MHMSNNWFQINTHTIHELCMVLKEIVRTLKGHIYYTLHCNSMTRRGLLTPLHLSLHCCMVYKWVWLVWILCYVSYTVECWRWVQSVLIKNYFSFFLSTSLLLLCFSISRLSPHSSASLDRDSQCKVKRRYLFYKQKWRKFSFNVFYHTTKVIFTFVIKTPPAACHFIPFPSVSCIFS